MLTECVGVPGSGKTTYVHNVVTQGTMTTPPLYVGKWYALRYIVMHPLFTTRWIRVLVSESNRTHTWGIARHKFAIFLNTIARLSWAAHMKGEVIIDEGIVQRLLTLFEHRLSDQEIQHYFTGIPYADHVVFIDTPDIPLDQRKKGVGRQSLGEVYAREWIGVVADNLESLKKSNLFK